MSDACVIGLLAFVGVVLLVAWCLAEMIDQDLD